MCRVSFAKMKRVHMKEEIYNQVNLIIGANVKIKNQLPQTNQLTQTVHNYADIFISH